MSDTAVRLAPAAPGFGFFRGLRGLPVSAQSCLIMASLVMGMIVAGDSLLADPDTQWHIAVGRQIWTAGAVPTTDLYSHSFAGAPWIAKEWLSQLILFGAHAVGGWRGVIFVTALAIGLTFGLLHEWLQRRLHPILALSLTLLSLPLAMPHFLARPHILVLPIIVAWMIGVTTAAERGRAPPLALALLMALWANMHGSFPLGLVMAGLAGLESVATAQAGERLMRCWRWGLFLAVALAATTLSPYGWQVILVPLRMEGNAETLKYVNEWKPLGLGVEGCFALAMMLLALAALVRHWRANVFKIVGISLLGAMMFRHARFVSLFGPLAPIMVAPALARFPRFAARPAEEPGVLWGVAGALGAAALVALAVVAPTPSAKMTPEAAYQAAVAAGVQGPVLNDYDFGGFLIAHGVKTFIDGRTDQLFLGDFLPAYEHAIHAKDDADFAAILQKYRITWALVRAGGSETRHLSHMPGWTQIHTDDVAAVFVKR